MTFDQALNETKKGYKSLATAAGGSATPAKVNKYLDKIDDSGKTNELEKAAKKKGLKGKKADAYKWAVIHKMMKGHFNK